MVRMSLHIRLYNCTSQAIRSSPFVFKACFKQSLVSITVGGGLEGAAAGYPLGAKPPHLQVILCQVLTAKTQRPQKCKTLTIDRLVRRCNDSPLPRLGEGLGVRVSQQLPYSFCSLLYRFWRYIATRSAARSATAIACSTAVAFWSTTTDSLAVRWAITPQMHAAAKP